MKCIIKYILSIFFLFLPLVYPFTPVLRLGDINSDGLPDFIICDSDSITITNLNLSYRVSAKGYTKLLCNTLVIGDITGDDIDDIIVGTVNPTSVYIIKGGLRPVSSYISPGSYAPDHHYIIQYFTDNIITGIDAYDFNQDGFNDLIVYLLDYTEFSVSDVVLIYLSPIYYSRYLNRFDHLFYGFESNQIKDDLKSHLPIKLAGLDESRNGNDSGDGNENRNVNEDENRDGNRNEKVNENKNMLSYGDYIYLGDLRNIRYSSVTELASVNIGSGFDSVLSNSGLISSGFGLTSSDTGVMKIGLGSEIKDIYAEDGGCVVCTGDGIYLLELNMDKNKNEIENENKNANEYKNEDENEHKNGSGDSRENRKISINMISDRLCDEILYWNGRLLFVESGAEFFDDSVELFVVNDKDELMFNKTVQSADIYKGRLYYLTDNEINIIPVNHIPYGCVDLNDDLTWGYFLESQFLPKTRASVDVTQSAQVIQIQQVTWEPKYTSALIRQNNKSDRLILKDKNISLCPGFYPINSLTIINSSLDCEDAVIIPEGTINLINSYMTNCKINGSSESFNAESVCVSMHNDSVMLNSSVSSCGVGVKIHHNNSMYNVNIYDNVLGLDLGLDLRSVSGLDLGLDSDVDSRLVMGPGIQVRGLLFGDEIILYNNKQDLNYDYKDQLNGSILYCEDDLSVCLPVCLRSGTEIRSYNVVCNGNEQFDEVILSGGMIDCNGRNISINKLTGYGQLIDCNLDKIHIKDGTRIYIINSKIKSLNIVNSSVNLEEVNVSVLDGSEYYVQGRYTIDNLNGNGTLNLITYILDDWTGMGPKTLKKLEKDVLIINGEGVLELEVGGEG